jgi:CRISPR/Cas system CMR subunit Cmr4 (Cas7 group RAMP superfamily)
MARYNNKRNNINMGESQNVSNKNVVPSIAKNKRNDDDLIIDDKSVYEIDSECYERVRRARLNAKKK